MHCCFYVWSYRLRVVEISTWRRWTGLAYKIAKRFPISHAKWVRPFAIRSPVNFTEGSLQGNSTNWLKYWFGLLGVNASATARVIARRWNDDDDEISFLVEETGVPGGNHRPTASNWWNFSHIRSLPSPGIELGPQRCEAKWAKARWERRLSSPSYRGPSLKYWLFTFLNNVYL